MLFDEKRIQKLVDLINKSTTEEQFNHRKVVFNRFLKVIKAAKSDEEYYALAWNDFPVWCISFIDDDQGNPMFPAPWQSEYAEMMARRKYVWALCSRKVGKSTLLAVKNLHDLCGLKAKRLICFAPTMKQDYVFEKMVKYLQCSPYLYENFVKKGDRTSLTKEYMELSNGSVCSNKTVGLTTKGELIRGEYGDIVTIDEVQKIEEQVMRQIIRPIIADAYSEKKFRIIGTPNLFTNPDLEKNWMNWIKDSNAENSEYGFMQVDWKRGVKEGCLDEKYVLSEKASNPPDMFAMEYEARFPEQFGRFFPMEMLETCIDRNMNFKADRQPLKDYAMAVDFARYQDRTQILVGEVDRVTKFLKYVAWREIDPRREKIDYETQVQIIKDIFWQYNCDWICPDATSTQDAIIRMLITGEKPIPAGRIQMTGDRLGYCASDVLNHEMWKNHRQQITRGRIKVPCYGATEERFANQWRMEHNELQVKAIRGGAIIKLEEQSNGFKDLAVASGMLSLYIQKLDVGNAYMGIGTF